MNAESAENPDNAAEAERPDDGRRPRRPGPALLRIGVVGLLALAGVVVLADEIARPVSAWLLPRVLPWEGEQVRIGGLDIRGSSGFLATDVELVGGAPGDTLSLDSLEVRFRARDLLRAPRRVAFVRVVGAHVRARESAEGWGWLEPFGASSEPEPPPSPEPSIELERVEVASGRLVARDPTAAPLLSVDGLELTASGLAFGGPDPALTLEDAEFRLDRPGITPGWLEVGGSVGSSGGVWELERLSVVDSAGGRLSVEGTVGRIDGGRTPVDLQVLGSGVHLAQLDPTLARVFAPEQRLDLEASLRGTAGIPEIDATLDLEGAGVMSAESRLELEGDARVLEIEAAISALDARRATGGRWSIEPIDGTLAGRLDMTRPDSIDGPLTFDLGTAIGPREVALAGEALFRSGEAEISADARLQDFEAGLSGRIRPVGVVQDYDLEVLARTRLPLPEAVTSREPGWAGPWDARVRVAGQGFDPGVARATLGASLDPVVPGPAEGGGRLDGRLAEGTLSWELALDPGGGELEGEGSLKASEAASSWRVDRLAIRGLRIGPWVGGDDPGLLFADLRAGASETGIRADLVVDSVRGGRWAGVQMDLAAARSGRRTTLTGAASLDEARIDLAELQLQGTVPDRVELAFAALDPSDFGPALPSASLNGRVDLARPPGEPDPRPAPDDSASDDSASDGSEGWLELLRLGGRLTLAPSTLEGEEIEGEIDASISRGAISVDLGLRAEEESILIDAGLDPTARPRTLEVERAEFRRVDPSLWSAGRLPAGRVSGSASGRVTGFTPATATGSMRIDLDSTRVGPLDLRRAAAELDLAAGEGRLRLGGTGSGRVGRVEASARRGATGAWWGSGTALVIDSTFEAGRDSLALDLEFETPDSAGTGPWRLATSGSGPVLVEYLDSIAAEVAVTDVLTLENLRLVGSGVEVAGSGRLPLDRTGDVEADLRLDASLLDIGPVARVVGRADLSGSASLNLTSSGPAKEMVHAVSVSAANLEGRLFEVDSLVAGAVVTSDSTTWVRDVQGLLAFGGERPPLFAVGPLPLLAGVGSSGSADEAGITGGGVQFSWLPSAPKQVSLGGGAILIDGVPWSVETRGTVSWDAGITVRGFDYRSENGGTFSVDGTVDPEGDQDLRVDLAGLPVQLRGRGGEEALAGLLDLAVRFTGPASAPTLSVNADVVSASGTRALALEGGWTGDALEFAVEGEAGDSGRYAIEGRFPLRLSLRSSGNEPPASKDFALAARARGVNLGELGPLLDPRVIASLEGRLEADLAASGALSSPVLRGYLQVDSLSSEVGSFGTVLSTDALRVDLARDRATLAPAVLRGSGDGTMEVSGSVAFPELSVGDIDLRARMIDFEAADSRDLEAVVSGELTLDGTLAQPRIGGSVTFAEATWELPQGSSASGLETIELTEDDYLELERRFGLDLSGDRDAVPLWERVAMDLAVTALSNVWVRRSFEPALAVELGGELSLTKEAGSELEIRGALDVVEGRSFIDEFGRRFDITSGSVRWTGPVSSLELEAEARYLPVEDVAVLIDVTAGVDGFALELGSEPALPEVDIISYLTTGRPSTDIQQFGEDSDELRDLGADIALGRVSGGIAALARERLGLDVVEIRQDGLRGLTLVAGQYLSRRLFLGFSQPVVFRGEDRTRFGIDQLEVDSEFRINDWLLANFSGGRSIARFFLETRYAY